MKNNTETSCLFWYTMRALRPQKGPDGKWKSIAVNNPDGSPRMNDNYLSFLQVISTYWESTGPDNDPKLQLNIFCNGGSVTHDRETGERSSKIGYTVTFPQFLGEKFMAQFWAWSCAFGLGSAAAPTPTTPAYESPRRERAEIGGRSRTVNPADFGDPSDELATLPEATFES